MSLFHWKKQKKSLPQNQLHLEEKEVPAAPAPINRLLSYQAANLQGIGSRKQQEDSFAFVNAMDVTEIRENGLLAVVADGMGGMKGGKQASETVIACLKEDFQYMDREDDLAYQLCDSIFRASKKVCCLLNGEGGSTVAACIIFREQLYFASVGDSYFYLKRKNQIYKLNHEHNARNYLYLEAIRSGNMDPEPARQNPEADALTQFLGKDSLDEIDYFRRPLSLLDGDRLLLCSDGIGGVLNEQELLTCLCPDTPMQSLNKIEQCIRQKDIVYQDNYTALMIHCGY